LRIAEFGAALTEPDRGLRIAEWWRETLTRRARRFLLRQGFGGTSRDARKRLTARRGIEPRESGQRQAGILEPVV